MRVKKYVLDVMVHAALVLNQLKFRMYQLKHKDTKFVPLSALCLISISAW